MSANRVYESLCFVSIYSMHLLARLCPKVSEKPKTTQRLLFSVKLGVIKHFDCGAQNKER